ncbi:MAG: four helix bundle protein [Phycisphaerales bacterium]|nr:four helix bundle protein [Phycisphaerales bacterium]
MGKGRLQPEFLERTEAFCDRCVAVAEQLAADGRFVRIVEQLAASGSSFGANVAEATEAMSVKDFRKCLSIAMKELAETRFWLRLSVRRGWITEARVQDLMMELQEMRLIVGAILARTRPRSKTA